MESEQTSNLPNNGTSSIHLPKILVVDDDLLTRTMLASILKKEGFCVIVAETGEDGFAKACQYEPDLILLDVTLPGKSGMEIATQLKNFHVTMDIPIVFISAQADVNFKVQAFSCGGSDYVTKPFHPAELMARVRVHMRAAQSYKNLIQNHLKQISSVVLAQQLLLPKSEDLPLAQFQSIYIPSKQAGGDFYDVFQSMDQVFEYVVADVGGHDLGTALPTAAIKALLRQNAAMFYGPEENVQLLNKHLKPVLSQGQFATMVYVQVNRMTKTLTLINAGHGASLYLCLDGTIEVLDPQGDLLGAFDEFEVGLIKKRVHSGERIFLFSDGMIECSRSSTVTRKEGITLLCSFIEAHKNDTLTSLLVALKNEFITNTMKQQDDLVLLAVDL
jgi:phosphoserine phosphatase RsbU/P